MTINVIPLPYQGDLIDHLKLHGREIEWLWRNGDAYIPVKPVCELLDLAWQPQHRKLTAPESRSGVIMMMTPDQRGRPQEHLCIAYPDFMMWLATISPSRVKEEAREPLVRLLDEIKLVIAAHYHDRLFGESREATRQLQGFLSDYVAIRPVRVRVRDAVANGWNWQMLTQNTSYTQKRLIETVKDLLRIGAIPHAPAGTPLAGEQLDLFAREG